MNKVVTQQWIHFRSTYSPGYKTFIINRVLTDQSHPLHQAQVRRARERKQEGLWWHVTTAADLSKSSCVRSWSRRRLRNAVVEELQARGYDEKGMAVGAKTSNSDYIAPRETIPRLAAIQGSLRLHVQAALIPAKFTDVKAEVGQLVDRILKAANYGNQGRMSDIKLDDRAQRKPFSWPQQKKRQQLQR